MKHMKTIIVPEHREERVDKVICDFCGSEIKRQHWADDSNVEIYSTSGESYPEGSGWSEKTSFDCCKTCWGDKVLPALELLGATPTFTENSY